jgi:dihydrofolate reductase
MNVSIIVAIALNGAIGKRGSLLWHISEDLRYFKKITDGNTVVMGRKTWESLPKKPLPDRRNIVLTKNKNYVAQGAEIFDSVEEVLKKCSEKEKIFCIGGGTVYKEMLPYSNNLYITRVFKKYEADTFVPTENLLANTNQIQFPDYDYFVVDMNIWKRKNKNKTEKKVDEQSGLEYQFEEYSRINKV